LDNFFLYVAWITTTCSEHRVTSITNITLGCKELKYV